MEIGAALTALICIFLTIRNSIWNWVWGLMSVVLYAWVFWTGNIYANAWLQILYYVPIQFIGWYVWLRFGPKRNDDLPVTELSTGARLGWIGATTALTVLFYWIFRRTADPLPLADGLTTALSIVAQYLQVYKRFENWLFWIAADLIYVFYLFPTQKLYVSTGLYVIFTVMAAMGAIEWVRIMRAQGAGLEECPVS